MDQILMVKDYYERLQALHDTVREALEGLPQEALDWSPSPEMNTVNALVFHLTGSERFWIGDIACGEPSNRDRDAEYKVHGLSCEDLVSRLAAVEDFVQEHLVFLAKTELDEYIVSPTDGKKYRVFWALAHALEHTALHLGHIQILRQLWDMRGRTIS